MTADQSAMVLRVARAGAVFPIDFPNFGEPGPAWSRATLARLRAAARRACSPRLELAIGGTQALIQHGLLGQPRARLLDGIGEVASDPANDLTALVALAIATVSRHFSPNSDDAAELWIELLRGLHQDGWRAGEAI